MRHICHLLPSLNLGGAERIVLNLVRDRKRNRTTVCSLESGGDLVPELRSIDADFYTCGERFRFDPIAIRRLHRHLSTRDIDILHTHLPYAQVVGRLIARKAGIRTVVSTQHSIRSQYHPVTGWLERVTARYDDATVAVSEGVKESFIAQGGKNSGREWHVIYNGIDVAAFNDRVSGDSSLKEELSPGPVFLNVGRCVEAKAQSDLIAAMPRVISTIEDAHLLIAGDGPLLEGLRKQINHLGIESHVTLAGKVTPIEPYYAAADVFVLPSRAEGLPMALVEAMAAKLPTVATDIPGISEVVEDGETGHLVSPNSPEQLGSAMLKTIQNEPKRIGFAAYQRAKREFDMEKMVSKYDELYEKCAGTAGSGEY